MASKRGDLYLCFPRGAELFVLYVCVCVLFSGLIAVCLDCVSVYCSCVVLLMLFVFSCRSCLLLVVYIYIYIYLYV